jgi:FlaA1/EpsC-like NDP-sugar epimerase
MLNKYKEDHMNQIIEELNMFKFASLKEEELVSDYINEQKTKYFSLDESKKVYLRNKTIVVLGAAGSIASELIAQLLDEEFKMLLLIDKDENALYALQREMKQKHSSICSKIQFILADIRRKDYLSKLFEQYKPQVVFHYANYKSLVMGNASPDEFIDVNIRGTYVVLNLCYHSPGLERFIYISSDKAELPTNIYGKTKRICEFMVQTFASQNKNIQSGIMRYCNVLDAAGSFAIPTFRKQIMNNEAVTIRRSKEGLIPDRYFITKKMAAQLAILVGCICEAGNIFSLNPEWIRSIRIDDLVKMIMKKSNLVKDVESWLQSNVIFSPMENGEKLSEDLGRGTSIKQAPLIQISTINIDQLDKDYWHKRLENLLQLFSLEDFSISDIHAALDTLINEMERRVIEA